jgi:hypothetical protein
METFFFVAGSGVSVHMWPHFPQKIIGGRMLFVSTGIVFDDRQSGQEGTTWGASFTTRAA